MNPSIFGTYLRKGFLQNTTTIAHMFCIAPSPIRPGLPFKFKGPDQAAA
jgi:hypothetical protein